MGRKITVTINADVTFETTKEEEEIIKKMRHAEDKDDWDRYCELENKFEEIISNRVSKEIKNIKDINVLDTNWD